MARNMAQTRTRTQLIKNPIQREQGGYTSGKQSVTQRRHMLLQGYVSAGKSSARNSQINPLKMGSSPTKEMKFEKPEDLF